MQYKLEFTTQKQIAEELVAFANTRGGIIVFGVEDVWLGLPMSKCNTPHVS